MQVEYLNCLEISSQILGPNLDKDSVTYQTNSKLYRIRFAPFLKNQGALLIYSKNIIDDSVFIYLETSLKTLGARPQSLTEYFGLCYVSA